MVTTITYDNKVAINENPNIADVNKVKDDDMNEIKSVVNNNATELSNTETAVTNLATAVTKSFKGEKGRVASNQMSNKTIGGVPGKEYVLYFTETYTNVPTVLVSVWNNNVGSYGGVACAVGEITTTTCSLYFMANVAVSDLGLEYLVISND
jgi:hypothetical protein